MNGASANTHENGKFPMNKLSLPVLSGLSGAGEATLPNYG